MNPVALEVIDVFSSDQEDNTEAMKRLVNTAINFSSGRKSTFDLSSLDKLTTIGTSETYLSKDVDDSFRRLFRSIPKWFVEFFIKPDDFYKVGEPKYKTIYVPMFQVLCQGGAESRFVSEVRYSSKDSAEFALDLQLEGIGVNYDSHDSFSVSFKTLDDISGSYQVSIPAFLKIETFRHKTNDDLTGTRSAITSVGSEASLIKPEEKDFATIDGLHYPAEFRFGLPDNLAEVSYKLEEGDTLEGSVSFPLQKDAGKFGLKATIRSETSLEVDFRSTKKGVFDRYLATNSRLAQKFDATNVDYG